jgi:glycosyltransferase involved in cell wall biosynthesis
MRIAFIDPINWDYKIASVYQRPLGGSQSALCYLGEALAKQGHEVFLLNNTLEPDVSCGVMHLPLATVPRQFLRSLDAVIILNQAEHGRQIRSNIGDNTRLILWNQHAHDQPAVKELHNSDERDSYDGIALVSNWQREQFHDQFGINLSRAKVLRNAISPAFSNLFPTHTSILTQKSQPPILAYTSTPFRGLDVLLEVFPRIRAAIPGTRLKVFSSMKVYQINEVEDQSQYGLLYRQCQEMEGVEYIGSLPQPELARELRSVMVLAYPNTFAETSCIAVMEAMASGCWVVTSELGALPETTAGFGRLISMETEKKAYNDYFVEETVRVLQECTATDTTISETHLKRQIEYINSESNWSIQAQRWVEWLSHLGSINTLVESPLPIDSARLKSTDWQLLAYQCLIQNEYCRATVFYEKAIETCPLMMSGYWYLGLTLLLQGQEEEAQTTWMLAMVNSESEQVNLWTAELLKILEIEAERFDKVLDYQTSALIRGYVQEIKANY